MTLPRRGIVLALALATSPALPAIEPETTTGQAVLTQFQSHLGSPECADASATWRRHYAPYVRRLIDPRDPALGRFDYVLTRIIAAGLPSEYAMIPFVESHYEPDQRSGDGPAGLWQFTAATARSHGLHVGGGRDDRMSMEASTRAALTYLKTLHRQFGGNWRTTVMAYNAGDGRMRIAQRRGGAGLSFITRIYPDKIHAIACDILGHGDSDRWKAPLQRTLPRLQLPRVLREPKG
ncbi:lytic transglycosylase domain-containing protein [Solilutibacter silvestris]|uniref:Transglycosylase SLT domain-containing protein n=1 Tax=Solilutibacter silvestris TaxID=1645665 RepID=A0A2K1PZT0_9GAMM|nr:lytic transglycosylase domain-containing protein [Lysobacter silvestris]PNS08290.1 Transglycosylase SLT domain-containing protein [Lysobacter silvestris]